MTADERDVQELTYLLDLLKDFPSNEQRARYLLSSNWLRDRGAAAARRNADALDALLAERFGGLASPRP